MARTMATRSDVLPKSPMSKAYFVAAIRAHGCLRNEKTPPLLTGLACIDRT